MSNTEREELARQARGALQKLEWLVSELTDMVNDSIDGTNKATIADIRKNNMDLVLILYAVEGAICGIKSLDELEKREK